MRPIQLGLGAFGPYLEPVSVDFRKLAAQELFLIHGPVGSGKTTLLDAICFALYGCSSGGERTAYDMRNDMAEESQPTTVVFDFSRGHAQYRVKRQILSRRRDEGHEVRSAQMWNLTGLSLPETTAEPGLDPLPTESAWDGVTQLITELLGLAESEFRRSIVIPQGQFRQLLCAPPSEREHILSAIFDTSSYKQVVLRLEKSLEEQQEFLRLYWQKREELAVEMHLDSGEDVLERLDLQKKSLLNLEVELLRLQQLQESFVVDAGKNAILQERSHELSEARQVLARLEEEESRLEAQRLALNRFQAADSLGDYRSQLAQAKTDLAQAEEELKKAQRVLQAPGTVEAKGDSTEKSLEDLRASQELHSELKVELGRVDEAGERLAAWEQACLERDRQQQLVDQLHEQLEQLGEALRESQERLTTLTSGEGGPSSADRIRSLQERIATLQRTQKRNQQQGDVRVSVDRLRQHVVKSEQRCKEMQGKVTELAQEIERLRGPSYLSQALFLAAQLKEGEPCQVCGSREHPQPAQAQQPVDEAPRSGFIDRSRERKSPERLLEQKKLQLKQARALAEKLEADRSEQSLMLARLESRLETLQDETLEGPPSPREEGDEGLPTPVGESLARLTEELRLLEREALNRGKEENDRLRIQQRLNKLNRTHADLQTAFRDAELRLVQRHTLAEERQRQLLPSMESREKIDHHRKQILNDMEVVAGEMEGGQAHIIQSTGELAARQAALLAAERGLEMARERLRLAREVYEARSEAAGFSDLKEVGEALGSFEGSPKELRSQLQRQAIQLATARNRMERATTLFNESHEEVGSILDVETLRLRLDTLVQQKSACQAQIHELQTRSEEYQHCIEEINHLEPRLTLAKKLLRVASGDNHAKVSFQQYLLSQSMENVLLAANHRLNWMTRGRYSLQAVGSGLELEVRDHLSGQLRPVATLSGGESFLASLGLALGLTDSLSYGASASAIEALFIDEGFANLDDEALELAVQGLTQLQHEGRLVGVVSHLPELRERIHARLEVQAGPTGSRAQVVLHN